MPSLSLSNNISKDIKLGDRCILISENRPEWFISDFSITFLKFSCLKKAFVATAIINTIIIDIK